MAAHNPHTVHQIVHAVLQDAPTMIAERYPFAYAADFYFTHHEAFVPQPDYRSTPGRFESAHRIRAYAAHTQQDEAQVFIALAEAYLTEARIRATTAEKMEALTAQILVVWSAFGYAEAPDEAEARIRAAELVSKHFEAMQSAEVRAEMAEWAALAAEDAAEA